jgi:hypothetical protein
MSHLRILIATLLVNDPTVAVLTKGKYIAKGRGERAEGRSASSVEPQKGKD